MNSIISLIGHVVLPRARPLALSRAAEPPQHRHKTPDMKRYLVPFIGLLLASCSSTPSVLKSATIPVVQNQELPPPTGGDLISASRPYLIGPFDKLAIQVFGVDALNQEQIQVDANGDIQMPLVGLVAAAGKTPNQLAGAIADRLTRYVKEPQVSVNLVETLSQVVTVDGQVMKPGLYPVIGKMTLMRTVATAGGLGEFAKLNDVVVFRTVDGKRYAALYNLGAIRAGAYSDPEIYANDIVVVGDSKARRLFKDLLQLAPAFTSPLIVLLRG